jgi:hypothetical protein
MQSFASLYRIVVIAIAISACNGSSKPSADAGLTGSEACQAVGTSFCAKMYACYSPADLMGFQLPATEDECVALMNAHCADSMPMPGYCKGHPQASIQAATACAAEFDGLTCAELMQTPSGACKTQLCSP